MTKRSQHFVHIPGAERERDLGKRTELRVNLDCRPARSMSLLFPTSQIRIHATGEIFATDWILKKISEGFRVKRQNYRIRVNPNRGYWI